MRTQQVMILVSTLLAVNACAGDDDDGTAIDAGGSGGQMSAATGGKPAGSGGSAAGGTGGRAGSGGMGSVASGGTSAGGGTGGKGGSGTGGGSALDGGAGQGSGSDAAVSDLDHFSFFVTSLEGMQRLADNPDGFGGDLTYGEADGLSGADKICEDLAESSMPGSAVKQWRAFLSAAHGPGGGQVNAIDRVGDGPWYDRRGRVVALSKADLLHERPEGADPAIAEDLPNESGTPNMQPDPTEDPVDNHHVLTGSNADGELYGATSTCEDWTSTAPTSGRPRIGFSWSIDSRVHWISGQDEGGCGAGVVLGGSGGSNPDNPIVGSGGGYGAIYCFALEP